MTDAITEKTGIWVLKIHFMNIERREIRFAAIERGSVFNVGGAAFIVFNVANTSAVEVEDNAVKILFPLSNQA